MKRIILLLPSFLFCFAPALKAQVPSIKIKGEKDITVSLNTMDIRVEIIGNVATTTMKMVFHNHTSRVLEGELTFPMPEGIAISRYAIDINGKLREAVPVPKAKATEVFESIEYRQVDPGLLERVEGNNFRTRIYPLPANGERTVLVAYEETLTSNSEGGMRYHLPLHYQQQIADFSLQTKIYQSLQKPQLIEQPDGSFVFSENNRTYEASLHKQNYRPQKSLTIRLPQKTDIPEVVLQENRDGSFYFLINAYLNTPPREKAWSNRIGIIWDNSLSGLQRDIRKELALLDKIIKQKQNLTVELGLLNITFGKVKRFSIANGEWSELRACLENMSYDGGTDFSAVDEKALPADEYLFFSDGLSTFGENTVSIRKPVYTICSSAKADYSALKAISGKTGGKFVNLQNITADDACRAMGEDNLQFLGIQEKHRVSEVYPAAPAEMNGHISVAGIAQRRTGEITLLFGRNGKTEQTQKVQLKGRPADIKVDRIWAQKKIAEMDIRYEQNKDDIELLGKQFGIVTRNTSLIVLEDITDYIQYKITPPTELLAEYNELVKYVRFEEEQRIDGLLGQAILMVNELKEWWKTDFSSKEKHPKPVVSDSQALYSVAEEILPATPSEYPDDHDMADYATRSGQAEMVAPRRLAEAGQVARIRLPKILSDKEYMKQISSANDPYASYLTLRKTYMGTPGFYLDISNFFYESGQQDKGLLVLSSLAELDIENAELFKTLAYRLKEKEAYAHELFITGKIREWRPMDAQSHRDYALALQDNGRYQEALECLYSILNLSYSPEARLRDFGIEEVVVCEINNLISLHRKKLNLSKIDSRIIASLPVAIRVVINWNKNATDIDLWVTDPNGKRCYYANPSTAIGGRISHDITQGFGPEQFLLRKAINGIYTIETNFYGENQLTLSGPTTIMGEIYLYYSDGRERRQVITFMSGENGSESEGVLIGEFEFSDKATSQGEEASAFKSTGADEADQSTDSSKSSGMNAILPVIGLCCLLGLLIVITGRNRKDKHQP